MNKAVLLVAIHVYIVKYEVRRKGKERKLKVSQCYFGKCWFVKWGNLSQYEEEYECTFSNISTSSTQVSSSSMKTKIARLPLILPDTF